jgi:small subunit ribosomal protein S7
VPVAADQEDDPMAMKRPTASRRQLKPDPRYGSLLLAKFINCLMWSGKKSVAQRSVYDALETIRERVKDAQPVEVFQAAIENVKPKVEVRSRRVGGATYQVPVEVSPRRQQALSFRWLIRAARARRGRPMSDRLAEELLAAYRKEGAAVQMRENIHRMAEANKAFAHFAW